MVLWQRKPNSPIKTNILHMRAITNYVVPPHQHPEYVNAFAIIVANGISVICNKNAWVVLSCLVLSHLWKNVLYVALSVFVCLYLGKEAISSKTISMPSLRRKHTHQSYSKCLCQQIESPGFNHGISSLFQMYTFIQLAQLYS